MIDIMGTCAPNARPRNALTVKGIEGTTMPGAKPYGQLQYKEVKGKRMAYIDEGQGDAIVFQHGNPTSSYLWRNVMPHLEGLGRLVACDLIGMGASDKLDDSGPDRYHYTEQRDYLFALWDSLDLGDRVIFVLHDWGSALGFDWANRHRDRVAGIAFMEAVAMPIDWSDFPEPVRAVFQGFRSPQGEAMVLDNNMFVEAVLPGAIQRTLSDEEMDHYRKPFRNAGEDRRPTLSWPRNIPIEGEPADVAQVVEDYGAWLAESDVPKLFINGEPGALIRGRVRDFVRSWPNQTEVSVPGSHFIQEDSPDEIGAAVASFVRAVRSTR
jgi:haloalkane dehalogenase